jgi:hypothetical protein
LAVGLGDLGPDLGLEVPQLEPADVELVPRAADSRAPRAAREDRKLEPEEQGQLLLGALERVVRRVPGERSAQLAQLAADGRLDRPFRGRHLELRGPQLRAPRQRLLLQALFLPDGLANVRIVHDLRRGVRGPAQGQVQSHHEDGDRALQLLPQTLGLRVLDLGLEHRLLGHRLRLEARARILELLPERLLVVQRDIDIRLRLEHVEGGRRDRGGDVRLGRVGVGLGLLPGEDRGPVVVDVPAEREHREAHGQPRVPLLFRADLNRREAGVRDRRHLVDPLIAQVSVDLGNQGRPRFLLEGHTDALEELGLLHRAVVGQRLLDRVGDRDARGPVESLPGLRRGGRLLAGDIGRGRPVDHRPVPAGGRCRYGQDTLRRASGRAGAAAAHGDRQDQNQNRPVSFHLSFSVMTEAPLRGPPVVRLPTKRSCMHAV